MKPFSFIEAKDPCDLRRPYGNISNKVHSLRAHFLFLHSSPPSESSSLVKQGSERVLKTKYAEEKIIMDASMSVLETACDVRQKAQK